MYNETKPFYFKTLIGLVVHLLKGFNICLLINVICHIVPKEYNYFVFPGTSATSYSTLLIELNYIFHYAERKICYSPIAFDDRVTLWSSTRPITALLH